MPQNLSGETDTKHMASRKRGNMATQYRTKSKSPTKSTEESSQKKGRLKQL
jgi:hypothetical protein